MTTSSAASDENFIKIIFSFQRFLYLRSSICSGFFPNSCRALQITGAVLCGDLCGSLCQEEGRGSFVIAAHLAPLEIMDASQSQLIQDERQTTSGISTSGKRILSN